MREASASRAGRLVCWSLLDEAEDQSSLWRVALTLEARTRERQNSRFIPWLLRFLRIAKLRMGIWSKSLCGARRARVLNALKARTSLLHHCSRLTFSNHWTAGANRKGMPITGNLLRLSLRNIVSQPSSSKSVRLRQSVHRQSAQPPPRFPPEGRRLHIRIIHKPNEAVSTVLLSGVVVVC